MTDRHDTDTVSEPSTEPGPAVLEERSLLGIFVHLIMLLPFGFVVVGLAYLLSDHEFTRQNARNAINWTTFVLLSFLGGFALFFVAAELTDRVALPGAVEFAIIVPAILVLLAVMAIMLLAMVLPLFATAKAIFGSAWTYPFAPDFVGRVQAAREAE
jgi:uncharacterized protein